MLRWEFCAKSNPPEWKLKNAKLDVYVSYSHYEMSYGWSVIYKGKLISVGYSSTLEQAQTTSKRSYIRLFKKTLDIDP
jgi:hypothetical protein